MIWLLRVIVMPREARKKSISNIYHTMLRGINRQTIFEDDGDRHYFMTVVKHNKEISGFKLHAFCLMSNHIHMLIEPAGEPLDQIYKRIGSKYVAWYNKKYQRVGHLFQDRFRSEAVDNDQYYMTVLRYILQNPMKAGIEARPGTYPWSSFLAYEKGIGSVTDTEYALRLLGGRAALIDYLLQENNDKAMDEMNYDRRMREEQAKEIMERISGCTSAPAFQQKERNLQKEYVKRMYLEGLSGNHISRLTGMPKTTVIRTVKDIHPISSAPAVLREEYAYEKTADAWLTEIW